MIAFTFFQRRSLISAGWIFLAFLFPFISQSQEIKTEPATLANPWIKVLVNSKQGGSILQYFAQNDPILFAGEPNLSIPNGALVLYASHPLSSTETIPIPNQYRSDFVQEATQSIFRIETEQPTQVSISRRFHLYDFESILHVDTTITNVSDKPVECYPAEIATFKTGIGNENTPNNLAYFYAPSSTDSVEQKGYDITLGLVNNTQFSRLRGYPVFIARYFGRIGEVKMTDAKNWYAFQNLASIAKIKGGTVCSVEYIFSTQKPEFVKDNLILFVNGAGEYILNKQLLRNDTSVPSYMRATYVLGRIQLAPGASFSYEANWTASSCSGPVIDVQNGLVFSKHLEVQLEPETGSLVNLANLGVPLQGDIGFLYYDENGNPLTVTDNDGKEKERLIVVPLDVYNPDIKTRQDKAVPFRPTALGHMIQIFGLDQLRDATDTLETLIQDKIHSVKMMLIDSDRNLIRELDHFDSPFPRYTGELSK